MCSGLGTKDHVLIDLCHMHTNAQLAAIKNKWEAKVCLREPVFFAITTPCPPTPATPLGLCLCLSASPYVFLRGFSWPPSGLFVDHPGR